ncbi:MAG: ribosome-associated translation inhibitor RaiA [bacterium]|nr:ribosome-associated translation inhibitor RaiA [bacterium]
MQMEIKSRHFTLGDDQRERIEAALEKLEKFVPRPVQSFKVNIDREAGRFVAEGVLHLKNHEFRADGEGQEPEYAADAVFESLRKQLTKFKERMVDRQKGEDGGLGRALADGGAVLGGESEGEVEGLLLPDLDVEQAKVRFTAGTLPFFVFRNTDTLQLAVIYRRGDGALGHMEAAGE